MNSNDEVTKEDVREFLPQQWTFKSVDDDTRYRIELIPGSGKGEKEYSIYQHPDGRLLITIAKHENSPFYVKYSYGLGSDMDLTAMIVLLTAVNRFEGTEKMGYYPQFDYEGDLTHIQPVLKNS